MKNVSMILNVVLIATLFYAGCNPNPGTDNKDINQTAKTSPTGQTDECNNVCMDYSGNPDYTIIDGETVKRMASDYRNTPNLIPDDANSVWFELDDLKKFIWNIEKSVCENRCSSDSLNLGIRIYYARYPQTGPGTPAPFTELIPEYQGMHTVFMVPTYDLPGSNNAHFDFYLDKPFANCSPVRIPEDDTIDPVGLFIPIGKNHGTLCPPYCNGAAFGN